MIVPLSAIASAADQSRLTQASVAGDMLAPQRGRGKSPIVKTNKSKFTLKIPHRGTIDASLNLSKATMGKAKAALPRSGKFDDFFADRN